MSDSGVSPAQVVNQVSRLVSSDEHGGGFLSLLGDTDVDRFSVTEAMFYCLKSQVALLLMKCLCFLLLFSSIIIKVRQHDEFFPPFHALVTEMFNILGK